MGSQETGLVQRITLKKKKNHILNQSEHLLSIYCVPGTCHAFFLKLTHSFIYS